MGPHWRVHPGRLFSSAVMALSRALLSGFSFLLLQVKLADVSVGEPFEFLGLLLLVLVMNL